MILQSFSVVATEEVWRELAILIYATRRFHPQPFYILCDEPVKEALAPYNFPELYFDLSASPEALMSINFDDYRVENDYHRADCIAKKMDAVERATDWFGNTLFLDADIVPVAPMDTGITHPVMVSPHYHQTDRILNTRKYGAYNAGYLFNSEPGLAELWRDIYTHRSTFFEQEGMVHFHEEVEVGKFDKTHNVGFWRMKVEGGAIDLAEFQELAKTVKSFHAHLTMDLFPRADPGLRRVYTEMMNFVLLFLATEHPDLYRFADKFR